MEPMQKIRNVGIADLFVPFGPFDGVNIPQGEVGEVPARLYDGLLAQPGNWQAAEDDDPPKKESKAADSKPSAAKKKDGD